MDTGSEKRMREATEKERELIKILETIKKEKNEDFVIGVLSHLDNDKEVQLMIDYINSFDVNDPVTQEDILLFSIKISRKEVGSD